MHRLGRGILQPQPTGLVKNEYFENQLLVGYFFTGILLNNSNLLSFLLRCGTRSNEWGPQGDTNSLVQVCLSSLLNITLPEAPNTAQ